MADSSSDDDLQEKIHRLKQAEAKEQSSAEDIIESVSEDSITLAELQKAKQEAEDRALRALADLQNAKKRMEEDRRQFAAFANQKLLVEFIGVLEDFQRSLAHLPEALKNHEWIAGILLVESQFLQLLARNGVSVISCSAGDVVDPSRHEVVAKGEGEGETVLEVYENGYELHGRVLKPAKVKAGGQKQQ